MGPKLTRSRRGKILAVLAGVSSRRNVTGKAACGQKTDARKSNKSRANGLPNLHGGGGDKRLPGKNPYYPGQGASVKTCKRNCRITRVFTFSDGQTDSRRGDTATATKAMGERALKPTSRKK